MNIWPVTKKVLRIIERVAHSVGVVLGIVALVWIGVIVGRPSRDEWQSAELCRAEQQHKRLAIFLDGTWNSVDSNTNVWRMRALCAGKVRMASLSSSTIRSALTAFWVACSGKGLDENIRLAYEWLIENYNDGDEIFIFGFSRGAFTARSLGWVYRH